MRYLLLVIVGLVAVGCTTTGSVSKVREKALQVSPGDPKGKVIEVLGTPGDRSFLGSSEAWQYCSTGWSSDTYVTVWFTNGKVTGLTSKNASIVDGFCSGRFPEVDWGQRPADKKIQINLNE